MSAELSPPDTEQIRRAVERISERAWGFAIGLLAALGLFVATAILVVRGGPNPGAHLGLLGVYLPGYSVTWPGAIVGTGYAFVLGYLAGRTVGTIYNRIIRSTT